MKSGVDNTPVMNLHVEVGVGKQVVQVGNVQLLACSTGVSPRAAATRLPLIEQAPNRGVTIAVGVTSPCH